MKIQIKIIEDGNLAAMTENLLLFEFDYRKECGAWLFWFAGWKASKCFEGPKANFPLQFFKDACRAKYFFIAGTLPDKIEITEGENLLK